MSSQDFIHFIIQISTMLFCALLFGHVARRLKQPAVLGEMIGGVVLGPTVFRLLSPDAWAFLFNTSDVVVDAREASIKLGMIFFLFMTGLETNLSDLKKIGMKALTVGLVGTILPILASVAFVYALPKSFWGVTAQRHFFAFALFIGMNIANSANPVLARILMDLKLLKTEIGSTCMTATVVDDLVNWTLFAIVLGDINPSGSAPSIGVTSSIMLVMASIAMIFCVGRLCAWALLKLHKRKALAPSGLISANILIVLVAASITELLGIHAFLGAFLIGVALSGNSDEYQESYNGITLFSLSFFAPIYFVSMGMTTDFLHYFNLPLVTTIVLLALSGKLSGVLLGLKTAGIPINKVAWGIAFGLNARGATGIILAGVGRAAGVIDEQVFVALVIMAIFTSLLAGPLMNLFLAEQIAQGQDGKLEKA